MELISLLRDYRNWLNHQKVLAPWLVWLRGLSAGLQTKRSLVQFPVRARAWVAGQAPSGRHVKSPFGDVQEATNQYFSPTSMFLSLSLSLPSPLTINK